MRLRIDARHLAILPIAIAHGVQRIFIRRCSTWTTFPERCQASIPIPQQLPLHTVAQHPVVLHALAIYGTAHQLATVEQPCRCLRMLLQRHFHSGRLSITPLPRGTMHHAPIRQRHLIRLRLVAGIGVLVPEGLRHDAIFRMEIDLPFDDASLRIVTIVLRDVAALHLRQPTPLIAVAGLVAEAVRGHHGLHQRTVPGIPHETHDGARGISLAHHAVCLVVMDRVRARIRRDDLHHTIEIVHPDGLLHAVVSHMAQGPGLGMKAPDILQPGHAAACPAIGAAGHFTSQSIHQRPARMALGIVTITAHLHRILRPGQRSVDMGQQPLVVIMRRRRAADRLPQAVARFGQRDWQHTPCDGRVGEAHLVHPARLDTGPLDQRGVRIAQVGIFIAAMQLPCRLCKARSNRPLFLGGNLFLVLTPCAHVDRLRAAVHVPFETEFPVERLAHGIHPLMHAHHMTGFVIAVVPIGQTAMSALLTGNGQRLPASIEVSIPIGLLAPLPVLDLGLQHARLIGRLVAKLHPLALPALILAHPALCVIVPLAERHAPFQGR